MMDVHNNALNSEAKCPNANRLISSNKNSLGQKTLDLVHLGQIVHSP